jgi:hypothetical protein
MHVPGEPSELPDAGVEILDSRLARYIFISIKTAELKIFNSTEDYLDYERRGPIHTISLLFSS